VDAGKETLSKNRNKLQSWVSLRTLELIEERRNLPRLLRERRQQIDRTIKECLKQDRDAYWQSIAKEMEDANRAGNTRKLYQLLRKCTGKGNVAADSIKKTDGTIVSKLEDKLQCWADHFHDLLHAAVSTQTDLPQQLLIPVQPTLNISSDPPTEAEIHMAIGKLKQQVCG